MKPLALFLLLTLVPAPAQDALPSTLPDAGWRTVPRAWKPTGLTRASFLDPLERGVRAMALLQNGQGAIIDPWVRREFQYATPYFAHALGLLLKQGRAKNLREAGLRAMEHSTRSFAGGAAAIPDRHGEFYIPALAGALEHYRGIAPAAQWNEWRRRLHTPVLDVTDGYRIHVNNWRAYAMRGEWMRVRAGLAERAPAVEYIESSWRDFQRERLSGSRWSLYLDTSSDPNSQAVEAVGRGNLLGLLATGYDGPSSAEMDKLITRATRMSLLLQDPTGQGPTNGRTDNHVWNDILYQLCFEMEAERALNRGEKRLAAQYRRAASLAFLSALRWQRADGAFMVTKNFFPNEWRTGYQPASQWTNYNGAVVIHLAEAFEARHTEIEEAPAPAEIGGYAFANDPKFASAFANAGSMQLMANLRGEVDPAKYNRYWTPLGIARFSRAGWDSRLGPLDGARDTYSQRGATFGPTWRAGERWVRLADVPERYDGTFETTLATPALVLCSVTYAPKGGATGPTFILRFTLTPDGILVRTTAENAPEWGLTLPVLEDDGRGPLRLTVEPGLVRSGYDFGGPTAGDEQTYLFEGAPSVYLDEDAVKGSAGWIKPVRVAADTVFVYPRTAADPPAAAVRAGLRATAEGFETPLVRVSGHVAVGRGYAGGVARAVDLDGDGRPDLEFSEETGFVARHDGGRLTLLETSLAVTARYRNRAFVLRPHEPLEVPIIP